MLFLLRRPCVAFALTFLASAFGFVSATRAQTTWTITVAATGAGPKPKYSLQCTSSLTGAVIACPNNPSPDEITINMNDTVKWCTKAHNEVWITHDDPILDDSSGQKTHHHHAKDNICDGGPVDKGTLVDPTTKHEYYVFAFDSQNKNLYVDDPRIIIGGTGLEDSLRAIHSVCEDLRSQLAGATEATKGKAKDLCVKIEALLHSLESTR